VGQALNAPSLRAADAARLLAPADAPPPAGGAAPELPAALSRREARALVAAFRPRLQGGGGGGAPARGGRGASSGEGGSGGEAARGAGAVGPG
jgi:hypothetical protein